MGLPGLAGADHIGITVPDLEAATRFFVDVIGCKVIFEVGPFASDDDWMQRHLGVDPRSRINKLRTLKCANGPSIELFEYEVKEQNKVVPKNSDVGGHHVGFYVTDLDAAVAHLRRHGVKVLGEPTSMNEGPSDELRWVYFVSPGKPADVTAVVSANDLTREQFQALAPNAVIDINGERITKSDFQARNTKALAEAVKQLQDHRAHARAVFEAQRKALLDKRAAALAEANKKAEAEVTKLVAADAAAHGPNWDGRKKQAADLFERAAKATPTECSDLLKQAADLLAPAAK